MHVLNYHCKSITNSNIEKDNNKENKSKANKNTLT